MPPVATVLAKTLPRPDLDSDGIADAEDGCPDRAGVASPDPIRNGCPAAAEKALEPIEQALAALA